MPTIPALPRGDIPDQAAAPGAAAGGAAVPAERPRRSRRVAAAAGQQHGPGVAAPTRASRADKASATKARIIEAAQIAFSQGGYSHASLRDIAARAGVTSPLIVKYFATKADLFRAALIGALRDSTDLDSRKGEYAARMVAFVLDPDEQVVSPAMIALSLGDEDARAIIVSVVREQIIAPVSAWIGEGEAAVRASLMLILTTGLAIFGRHLRMTGMDRPDAPSVAWLTTVLQTLIDGGDVLDAPRSDT